MKNVLKSLSVLLALAAGVPAQAAISLTGTIRDFNAPIIRNSIPTGIPSPGSLTAHPDFQVDPFSGLVVPNIVKADLSADGVPVYAGVDGTGFGYITSADSFDQWYKNVAGVNQSTTLTISLDETSPGSGVFQYTNNSFFPIDNQLGGNQGLNHNFHFTYHIHAQFEYAAGQTFSFEGDDDVWVFFNGKLAIDLGGIHQVAASSVSLDAVAAQLGLVVGQTYDFDFFFAERHTSISNFTIQTSIPLREPGPEPEPDELVPEPGSLALWSVLGVAGLLYRRRRRAA